MKNKVLVFLTIISLLLISSCASSPKKEKIRSKYLYYILKNKNVVNFLQGLAESRSGTFPQITFSVRKNNYQ